VRTGGVRVDITGGGVAGCVRTGAEWCTAGGFAANFHPGVATTRTGAGSGTGAGALTVSAATASAGTAASGSSGAITAVLATMSGGGVA